MRLIDADFYKAWLMEQYVVYDHTLADIDAQPTIDAVPVIRCKDCRWWDKYGDDNGYCMAAKHGHWSKHWEISILRKYKGDFYCADAEPKGEQE